jgi:hypothetical protein
MFRKRIAKIDEIRIDNPHWHVEMRKRLLQQAALSVAMLSILEKIYRIELVSNLPQYAEKKESVSPGQAIPFYYSECRWTERHHPLCPRAKTA